MEEQAQTGLLAAGTNEVLRRGFWAEGMVGHARWLTPILFTTL